MQHQPRTPAHAYQEYFGPAIFEPLCERVIELAAPVDGEHVIDVACGTGIVTRAAAAAVGSEGRVLGVDINPVMIEIARSQPTPSGAPIEWREGDGTDLDCEAATFTLLTCQQGLQFFPDRAAGAREMRRVLAPGGRAVIALWRGLAHQPLFAALADAEEPHLAALGTAVTREELTAPFSFGAADALRDLLCDAGFSRVDVTRWTVPARFADADHFVERMEYAYGAVIPQFVEDPAAFATYLEAIGRDTASIVASHREGDEIVVPMPANIAVAHC